MQFIFDRLFSWMSIEPFIWFLMVLTAFILFLQVYNKERDSKDDRFWPWCKRVLEAAGKALLFLGILWAARGILNNNYDTFRSTHGRVSEVNYRSVNDIWGGPHVQRELSVTHTIEKTKLEEIPREDPGALPLYKKVTETVTVEQNSIVSFRGDVKLVLNKRKKGSAFYNGFETKFNAVYKIVNDSDIETDAHFLLPRSADQILVSGFAIRENDSDIHNLLRFGAKDVSWIRKMEPHKSLTLSISYETRGLDYFYYQIPSPREMKDFSLTIAVDDLPVKEVNYPEGCIPPTEKIVPTSDGRGSVLQWKFDNSVTTAGMGISLPQPEQPGETVALALANSTTGLMWLVIAIALTLLIFGQEISFFRIILICAAYLVQYIAMASISDFVLGFWGSLIIGAIVTLALVFFLLKLHEKRSVASVCIFTLVGFFSIVNPIVSLVKDAQESIRGIMMIVLIVYLFVLSLYNRKQNQADKE